MVLVKLFIFYKAGYLVYNISNPSTSRIQIGNFFRNGEDYIVGILGMYNINTGNVVQVSGNGRIINATSISNDTIVPSLTMFTYVGNYTYGNLTRNNTTAVITQISSNKEIRVQNCVDPIPEWLTASRLYDFSTKTSATSLYNTGSNINGYSWTNCIPSFLWFNSGLAPHADAGIAFGMPKAWIEYRVNSSQTKYHLISPIEYRESVNLGKDFSTLFPTDTSPNEYNNVLSVYIPREWAGQWLRLFAVDTSITPTKYISVVYGVTNVTTPFEVPLLNLDCINLKIYDVMNVMRKSIDVCGQGSIDLSGIRSLSFNTFSVSIQKENMVLTLKS
jgi:hypothetical protein